MALPATTVWEVRTDGNNANGGGFVTGASGTDFSQQAAAQVAYTDLVIDAVTNTKLTSAATPFTAAHVGNLVNITGGAGFTTGWYRVVSVAAAVATMDRAVGTVGSTGGTGNLGGALLTIQAATTLATIDGMAVYVRGGTYTTTAAITTPTHVSGVRSRLIGYTTTRGDLGRPIISVTTAVNGITPAGNISIENFEIDGTSTALIGIAPSAAYGVVVNCRIHHCTGAGVSMTFFYWSVVFLEIDNCAGGVSAATDISLIGSYVHNNTGPGFAGTTSCVVLNNLIVNNSGASSDGVQHGYPATVMGNTIHGNGRDGIRATVAYAFNYGGRAVLNNLLTGNAGYGINQPSATQVHGDYPWIDYNAFYNNTSGVRNNINASPHDVTLTADPFTNAAGNDFSLNATAGGGAACKSIGFPDALPGLATPLGYADIGVYRHKDPAQGPVLRGATL